MSRARLAAAGLLAAIVAFGAGCQRAGPEGDTAPAVTVKSPSAPGASSASGGSTFPVTGPVAASATAGAPSDPAHEEGRRIWNFRCYYCHGYSGDARTLASTFIEPRPRDFRATRPDQLSRESMIEAVRHGRPGTAMVAFLGVLNESEIERVVNFVREEFMQRRAENTRYHTAANGWPDHDRYRAAFPFATGEVPLDRPWESLDGTLTAGKRLFLSSCISCHDRAHVASAGQPWELFGVSYPPGNYVEEEDHHDGKGPHGARPGKAASPQAIDPYELHETPPRLLKPTAQLRRGERLFQRNCAHCHAADGTGRNWIGSFLDPHPPDFTDAAVRQRLTAERVHAVTRDGIVASSMPAWRDVFSPAELDAVSRYVLAAFVTPGARAR